MLTEETNKELKTAPANPETEIANEESAPEETGKGNWREAFLSAFQTARRQQKPAESRQELGRDKSKSLFLLVGVCVALLLLFLGIFSRPKQKISLPGENPRGEASLGRKVTPGQENSDPNNSVTPKLSADVRSADPALAGQLTAEDIGRTSRTGMAPRPTATTATATKPPQDYALSKVDFSDPSVGQGTTTPNPPSIRPSPSDSSADLKKPSLVFVRSTEIKPTLRPNSPEDTEETLALAAGTRLVARLQTPVSSAVAAPVVAVVEYNYERNGQIVLAAGSKVFGRLTQVNPSGYVGIQFSRVEMPDGAVEKVDASAMSLNFGPLKGDVSGKKTGTKFLVRSLTGMGTIASYLVGPQGSSLQRHDFSQHTDARASGRQRRDRRTGRAKRPGVQSEPRGDAARQHALLHRRPETIFGPWGRDIRDAKHRYQYRRLHWRGAESRRTAPIDAVKKRNQRALYPSQQPGGDPSTAAAMKRKEVCLWRLGCRTTARRRLALPGW